MHLHIPTSDISEGQNWCCVFKKMQYRLSFCIFAYYYIRYVTRTKLVLCIRKGAISAMSLQMCIQQGAISLKSLHIATSDISQGQNWCFVFKKLQYRLCLFICVFKTVQYRLSRCILLHLIYHKHKPGVVYSKRCNIALWLCILLHPIYHNVKTGVVY